MENYNCNKDTKSGKQPQNAEKIQTIIFNNLHWKIMREHCKSILGKSLLKNIVSAQRTTKRLQVWQMHYK